MLTPTQLPPPLTFLYGGKHLVFPGPNQRFTLFQELSLSPFSPIPWQCLFPILIIQPLLISNCLLSQQLLSKPPSSLPLKPFSLLSCLHPCCFTVYSENKSRFKKYSSNHVFPLLQIIQWLLISFKVKVKVKYLTVGRLFFY